MHRIPTPPRQIHSRRIRRPALLAAALALAAGAPLGLTLSGCGGSSQSLISTGFPAGAGQFSIQTSSSARTGQLVLTSQDLPSPVFFPPPAAVSDTDSSLKNPVSAAGSSAFPDTLILLPDTAYRLQNPKEGQFPKPITLSITYASARNNPAVTLNIYYFDGKVWRPVVPASGGFVSNAATKTVTTTIQSFQGTGLYAVFASQPVVPPPLS